MFFDIISEKYKFIFTLEQGTWLDIMIREKYKIDISGYSRELTENIYKNVYSISYLDYSGSSAHALKHVRRMEIAV